MKKILKTFSILLVVTNWALAQEINCDRKTNFGKTEICLPKIEGYKESYTEPIVMQLANKTEVPINVVLGFYLDNDTYKRRDSLGLFTFDNYFKIYATKQLKDYEANHEFLKQIQDVMGGNFISRNWESMEKEIDKIGLEVEIGVPTVVKEYNLNKNSFTYVMLAGYEVEGAESYTMAMTINGLLIKERILWMAYYLQYNGKETIVRLQEQSNTILTELLDAAK